MRLLAAATGLPVGAPRRSVGAWAPTWARTTTRRSTPSDGGAALYGDMTSLGLAADGHRRALRPERAVVIQDKQLLDRVDRERAGAGPPRRPRRLPVPAARDRSRPRVAVTLRLVRRRPRLDLPGGEAVRDRQRAEPAGVLAAAVRRRGANASAPGVRAVSRGRVRHAEGSRPWDLGRRRRSLAPRQRSPGREEQHLDVAGPVPARARRLVPKERPDGAAHGRVQLPPVPERGDRPARARIRVAERRLRQPRSGQAGALGRVRGTRSRRRSTACGSTSTRSAGRSTRGAYGLSRSRERPVTDELTQPPSTTSSFARRHATPTSPRSASSGSETTGSAPASRPACSARTALHDPRRLAVRTCDRRARTAAGRAAAWSPASRCSARRSPSAGRRKRSRRA